MYENENKSSKLESFPCSVTETLHKVVDVPTLNWAADSKGYPYSIETQWELAYKDNGISLNDMLEELAKYVEQDIAMTGKNTSKGKYLQRLLSACKGWEQMELCVEEL